MDHQRVTAALAPIMPAFVADGIELQITRADREQVTIELKRSADTCEACVMSSESLEQIVAECLRSAGVETRRVEVIGGG